MPTDVMDGIRYAHRLQSMGWPRADVMAALEEVEALPTAAEYAEEIARHRAILAEDA